MVVSGRHELRYMIKIFRYLIRIQIYSLFQIMTHKIKFNDDYFKFNLTEIGNVPNLFLSKVLSNIHI